MATLPQLIEDDMLRVDKVLGDFVAQTDAIAALLIDKGGFLIAHHGEPGELDFTTIGALASGAFMANQTIAALVNEKDFNSTYQQGETFSLFVINVDENCLLVVIFKSQTGIGVVKYYAGNATIGLARQLVVAAERAPGRGFDLSELNLANPQELFRKNNPREIMNATTTSELDQMLRTMIQSAEGISDLLFVADKPPQVEVHGALESVAGAGLEAALTGAQIENLVHGILNNNAKLRRDLAEHGSCDCSYSLRDGCRFRVNIYRQNGNYAMVMRRLEAAVPTLDSLKLPPTFREIIKEKKTDWFFVTGGSGNGKTTTLAAMLNEINRTSKVHVVTLEDPIEFLHPQLQSTFSQRELGRDFYNFPDGLRAALRQAPKVILVGEIRDRETLEIALTAGETGHLVFSTLHTISAGQTINRILGMFNKDEEQQVRERLVGSLRYIVGQRLVPGKHGGRLLVTELMGSSLRTREAMELGEAENRRLSDIIEAGHGGGWHSFEQSLLKAYEEDLITEETALLYSVNKPTMRQRLDLAHSRGRRTTHAMAAAPMITVAAAVVPAPPPVLPPIPPPAAAPLSAAPARNGGLKGMLNGLI